MNLVWQVQLVVKDASTFNNANQYRILNYSHEGLGSNFFGKAADFHTDAKARAAYPSATPVASFASVRRILVVLSHGFGDGVTVTLRILVPSF